MPTVRGRVIRILDRRTIIVNLGSNDGITLRSVFAVLGDPEPVVDPLTKEELGQVVVVKARVKAQQVYERFTICTTRWVEYTHYPDIAWESVFGLESETIDEGELRVDAGQVRPWKGRSEAPVKVGDPVQAEVQALPEKSSTAEPDSSTDMHDARSGDASTASSNRDVPQEGDK